MLVGYMRVSKSDRSQTTDPQRDALLEAGVDEAQLYEDLTPRGVGMTVLTGQGAAIDTTTAAGQPVFGTFAALAKVERELISELTVAGLTSA